MQSNSAICKEVQQKLSDIRMLSQIIDSEHDAIFDKNTTLLISDRKVSRNEIIACIDKQEFLIKTLQLEVTLQVELKELYKNDKTLHIY
jgi:hypothetical protein